MLILINQQASAWETGVSGRSFASAQGKFTGQWRRRGTRTSTIAPARKPRGRPASRFLTAISRTNVLSPGPVDTPMFDRQFPSQEGAAEARKQITAMTPLARLARPEEIASAALFLASDQSSYVAGIDLLVAGGLTAV